MSIRELEKKVDLLVDYVTCPHSDIIRKESLLLKLQDLKMEVSVLQRSGKSVSDVTEDLLTELGIPSCLFGYRYLTSAICLLWDNSDFLQGVCKKLYPGIAQKHNTTPSRVERSIRHAIEVCFDRGNFETISSYFGGALSIDKGKATNSEFIFRVFQLVKRRMEE